MPRAVLETNLPTFPGSRSTLLGVSAGLQNGVPEVEAQVLTTQSVWVIRFFNPLIKVALNWRSPSISSPNQDREGGDFFSKPYLARLYRKTLLPLKNPLMVQAFCYD